MANGAARRRMREQQRAQRGGQPCPDVAQGDLEGFALVRPDGSVTAEVVHVQWMDNHPAGPDTHVTVSFADGTNVEFAFDVPVVKIRVADLPSVTAGQAAQAAPKEWEPTPATGAPPDRTARPSSGRRCRGRSIIRCAAVRGG